MGCDKGAVEKTNRKVNTRTSLFLFRLLAEQLSPKSQLPPEFYPPIFSARRRRWEVGGSGRQGKKRQRGRKRRTAAHVPGCVCVCARKHTHKKSMDTHTHTHTLALQQR